ncbi:MAG: hypothetical protein WDA12_01745 [Bacilli bacterium]
MKKRTILSLLAIVLFLGLGYFIYVTTGKTLSYVSVSINPDIQLGLNEKGIVKEVTALNDEADVIIADLELLNKDVLEAVDLVVEATIETGYINEYSDENDVIVTAVDEREENRQKLEKRVVERVNKKLSEKKVYGLVVVNGVNDELKAEAKKYDVSNGKMLLMDRAVTVNPKLTKEELSTMSIKDIQSEIKAYVEKRRESLNVSKKEMTETMKKEKEELRNAHKKEVESLKDELLDNADVDTNSMNAEEKKETLSSLINERKEKIKENVEKYKREVIKEVEKKTYPELKKSIENERNKIKRGQERE